MTKQEIKQRIENLKKEINHHRYLYHVMDTQEISDAALDSLKHELYKLEQENPEFMTPDSPTQRVGGEPLNKFAKVHHKQRMISLEDAFSKSEMEEWEKRIKKFYPAGYYEYFGELKVDGFAISLIYKNGVLETAATRGDGITGENVTKNIKTIESVPLSLSIYEKVKGVDNPNIEKYKENIAKLLEKGDLEIRGEVYMSKKVFEKINREREKTGEPLYANPRNTAAGSIRQLDPKIAASRELDFLAYDIITDFGQKTHKDEHDILKVLGFKTDKYAKSFPDVRRLEEFWEEILKKREKLEHQIDGLVISVNDNATFEKLGIIGKTPRGAIAFKFPAEEATTIVEDISVQVGRTGSLTPVAYLKAVSIGGTTVTRASLHNQDEIKRLGLKIGDTVVVVRAGDVIPKVTKVFPNLRTGKEKEFQMPKKCPVCGEPIKKDGEVILKCVNKKCPAKNREALYHFTSKAAFDINGLGPKILDKLYDEGLIFDAADIFTLQEGDLVPIERFAEKSASNLVKSIAEKKEISLERFIYALGILHIGEETARLFAKQVNATSKTKSQKSKISELLKIFESFSVEDLQKIEDIGPKVAQSIYDYFQDRHNQELLRKFDDSGIVIDMPKISLKKQIFSGRVFVLTGELENFTRDSAKEKIRELGGDVSSTVSKNTDFVVAGANPGSKYDKAAKLGVKIMDEKEFIKMIQ